MLTQEVPIKEKTAKQAQLVEARNLPFHATLNNNNNNTNKKLASEDYNSRGDVRIILARHGWRYKNHSKYGNELWEHVDKGCEAQIDANHIVEFLDDYIKPFSKNDCPSPFDIYARLEHGNNRDAAESTLAALGFGTSVGRPMIDAEMVTVEASPFPKHLLQLHGLGDEIMAITNSTAPVLNKPLALVGAVSLIATLAGRVYRTDSGIRTNGYYMGLADSGTGKDQPRKVNRAILKAAGLSKKMLRSTFATGEGIEDSLVANPVLLYQTDEINSMFASMGAHKTDARQAIIMRTLLTMFSSSDSGAERRSKADDHTREVQEIDAPHLCVFGTAIPECFSTAVSSEMHINGLLSRLIVWQGDKRITSRRAKEIELSDNIIKAAQWFAARHGAGDFSTIRTVHTSEDGVEYEKSKRLSFDMKYIKAQRSGRSGAATMYSRGLELSGKLALIAAISENYMDPIIEQRHLEWGCATIEHHIQSTLIMLDEHSADSKFDGDCKKIINILKQFNGEIGRSKLMRESRFKKAVLDEAIDTLKERDEISETKVTPNGAGRPQKYYRLLHV